jgi:hypothetical protein
MVCIRARFSVLPAPSSGRPLLRRRFFRFAAGPGRIPTPLRAVLASSTVKGSMATLSTLTAARAGFQSFRQAKSLRVHRPSTVTTYSLRPSCRHSRLSVDTFNSQFRRLNGSLCGLEIRHSPRTFRAGLAHTAGQEP